MSNVDNDKNLEREAATADSRSHKERYDEVVEKAQLVAVQVRDINFTVDPSYIPDQDSNKFGYSIESVKLAVNIEHGLASLSVAAEVTVKNGRKKVLQLKVMYEIGYMGLEGCDTDAVRAFIRRVGTFTCWPYFRSLAATLDWSAGTGLPMLPVLREKVHPQAAKKVIEGSKSETVPSE